jgi:hypothetical protein
VQRNDLRLCLIAVDKRISADPTDFSSTAKPAGLTELNHGLLQAPQHSTGELMELAVIDRIRLALSASGLIDDADRNSSVNVEWTERGRSSGRLR